MSSLREEVRSALQTALERGAAVDELADVAIKAFEKSVRDYEDFVEAADWNDGPEVLDKFIGEHFTLSLGPADPRDFVEIRSVTPPKL